VLLSSHLLNEVEALADRLLVIGNGRLVAQGTKEELLAGSGMRVRALDPDALERALGAAGLASTRTHDDVHVVDAEAEAVGRVAAESGVVLLELRPADGARLEDLFLKLTGNESPEEVAR
jgi:ABC-2 type transport system ATP-binding protein